jgi:hypothetical protein
MGFELRCANDARYVIRFSEEEPLEVFRISPGDCAVAAIVFTTADGSVAGTREVPGWLATSLHYEAGQAYYLGDYFATCDVYPALFSRWRLREATDRYEDTAAKMRWNYPSLAALPVEDRAPGATADAARVQSVMRWIPEIRDRRAPPTPSAQVPKTDRPLPKVDSRQPL